MKQSKKMPAEKRREQLLKAARKVITKKGYAKATTEEIAREAGLTKGGLYFHFKNKEEVFFELIQRQMEKINDFFMGKLDESRPIEVVLNDLLNGIFEILDNKEYFNIDFWQKAHKVTRIRKYLETEHYKARDYYTEYILKHSKLSRKESQFLHDLLHVFIDGLVIQAQGFKFNSDLKLLEKGMQELLKLYLRRK